MDKKMEVERTGLEIAVIGMAGRFPGATDIHEFWDNIKNGRESISFFSDEELLDDGLDPALLEHPHYVKASGMIEGIEYFDAPFFGYIPREAEIMDPQIRIFHECVWAALEDGGCVPGIYDGLIGLFAGATPNFNWQARVLLSGKGNEIGNFAAGQLSQKDYLTLRISYKLDLKGPSFVLYTACSTSLVAIHLGCQSILNGECDIALAGGVTIIRFHKRGYTYQEGMIGSPDGHCRAFDVGGKGFAAGDGAGVVVLKRLHDAIANRDHIYAVVKGSAINNDGVRKAGFTAPSVEGQAEVVKMALQMAEVEAESIGYIETHGTGTALGDPVEMEGLKLAFNTGKKGFCAVGSVKTNVGHLDSAAGVAGFIKTVLVLKHCWIPPSLYFEIPNPGIDFISSPFYVNSKPTVWENGRYPLRAGVSSFGQGGTNAHVILEKWSEIPSPAVGSSYHLMIISAKIPAALERMVEKLLAYFKGNPGVNLADVAYTLQIGRFPFRYRKMFVCSSIANAVEILSGAVPGKIHSGMVEEGDNPVFLEESTSHLFCPFRELQDGDPQLFDLWEKVGRLWLKGVMLDWVDFYTGKERYHVSLPSYSFERHHYWIEEEPFRIVTVQDINNPGKVQERHEIKQKKEKKYPRPELSTPYIPAVNEAQKKLVDIWQSFFGFDRIGIHDDFFELGGDSLKAITLLSRIQKELDVLAPISEFFDNPSIEDFAGVTLANVRENTFVPIIFAEKKEYYPLSSAQNRLYILQQMDEENISYNMSMIVELEGEIRKGELTETFVQLINRHESLRTAFEMINDEPVQRIHNAVNFAVEFFDLSGRGEEGIKQEEQIVTAFVKPFTFSSPPLMRVALVKSSATKHVLLTDMHHIITDGFSMELLIMEFLAIYGGRELSPIRYQYKDYSEWLNSREMKLQIKRQEEYWLKEFSGELPELNIPNDYSRPSLKTFAGDIVGFELTAPETADLKALAEETNATLFMMLLAVYNVLLAKLSGQEDIIVGIGSAGRKYEEFQQIIGMFVNTLPLRNYPGKEKKFLEFLAEVQKRVLLAFDNQDYQFDVLVEKVAPKRKPNRNPLFDTVIVSMNMDGEPNESPGADLPHLKAKPYTRYKYRVSKFDISLLVREIQHKVIVTMEYNTKLFKKETIERFILYFKEITTGVLADKNIKLKDICISHQLLSAASNTTGMELGFED